ncbi:MAG: bifunctional fucokinase/L-fucose-1-P-guanylyltransferase [Clostridia bacterium]|nr:bifunctional fucokinase/L-fucose-1-P-guanylyltransferase [Clostridia bacterium]
MNPYQTLFLRQSYADAYSEYNRSLTGRDYPVWDYIVLTAATEAQAESYRAQIEYRRAAGKLPPKTQFLVIPDRDGQRVGSGGATLSVLREVATLRESGNFEGLKLLVIHSGGDSKRIPQYSACGKLFSPVPRRLADGRRSTLFDEFLIGMTGIPARIRDGMLVLSGDVLLLFNPLQMEFYTSGGAALSFQKDVETGKNHGVFLGNTDGLVEKFLHKQSPEMLSRAGAVDRTGNVDIDTGAILLSSEILSDLYALVKSDSGYDAFVNPQARLSFYGDFVYPMAASATQEDYLREAPEGELTDELLACRRILFPLLHRYPMRLIRFSPAAFIHFGTTAELLRLMTDEIENYSYLDWSGAVTSNVDPTHYAVSGSYIAPGAVIGKGAYIEDSYLGADVTVGAGAVVSGLKLNHGDIPAGCVLHGLKLRNGKFTVRFYGVQDNPKLPVRFGLPIGEPLWTAPLFPIRDTMQDAADAALAGVLDETCISLCESFAEADMSALLPYQDYLRGEINCARLIEGIERHLPTDELIAGLRTEFTPKLEKLLESKARSADFSLKIRLYDALSRLSDKDDSERYTALYLDAIQQAVLSSNLSKELFDPRCRIVRDEAKVTLPVRVNFGGGWTDTPPICMEQGGCVLNAQVTLDGRRPVEAILRRLNEPVVRLTSADNGSSADFTNLQALCDVTSPTDPFLLQKAALLGCGVLPYRRESEDFDLPALLQRLGGGFELSTRVIDIPRGSGLGTSSILAGACALAITEFFGLSIGKDDTNGTAIGEHDEIYQRVLIIEQIMSTGGGWQDQVGGIAPGVKLIETAPGDRQVIRVKPVAISPTTLAELNRRFCLIYTGQRRLARNLLRDVIGRYIAGVPTATEALNVIRKLAGMMRDSLEIGNIDRFAELLSRHWEASKQLDSGSTNTCIDQILLTVDDLIDGKMICGAGGGGYLQVILKKDVTPEDLEARLYSVFGGSGVRVQRCTVLPND